MLNTTVAVRFFAKPAIPAFGCLWPGLFACIAHRLTKCNCHAGPGHGAQPVVIQLFRFLQPFGRPAQLGNIPQLAHAQLGNIPQLAQAVLWECSQLPPLIHRVAYRVPTRKGTKLATGAIVVSSVIYGSYKAGKGTRTINIQLARHFDTTTQSTRKAAVNRGRGSFFW